MAEQILKCILFDQDAFRDVRMVVANFKQQYWEETYLPEFSETSMSELLYYREKPIHFRQVPLPTSDTAEGYILGQLTLDKVFLLGSNQDGLFLENSFDIPGVAAGKMNETDLDIVFEFHGIHITEKSLFRSNEPYLRVENSYPGYVRLRIKGHPDGSQYLIPENLKYKLRNILYRTNFCIRPDVSSGPALPGNLTDEFGVFDLDYVPCLTMNDWPSAAESFKFRKRKSSWPTPNIISEVTSTGCGFVGVGYKKSKTPHREWRISFSVAERILVRKLTNEQVRAYLYFKTLYKTHLQNPEALSTYMIKNILLWTVEQIPAENWRENNIFGCVEEMVDLLASYLERHKIPNYFVEKRNMIGHIQEATVADLYKKTCRIQKKVLTFILSCVNETDFAGVYDFPLSQNEAVSILLKNSNTLLSMVCFTMYLNIRLQVYRYICSIAFPVFKECAKTNCRSLFSTVSPRAVWYLTEAIRSLPDKTLNAVRLMQSKDGLVLDIYGLRERVVNFIRSDMYQGPLKKVFEDQEFVTNELVTCIPTFDVYLDWVAMTTQWQGGEDLNPSNNRLPVALD